MYFCSVCSDFVLLFYCVSLHDLYCLLYSFDVYKCEQYDSACTSINKNRVTKSGKDTCSTFLRIVAKNQSLFYFLSTFLLGLNESPNTNRNYKYTISYKKFVLFKPRVVFLKIIFKTLYQLEHIEI